MTFVVRLLGIIEILNHESHICVLLIFVVGDVESDHKAPAWVARVVYTNQT